MSDAEMRATFNCGIGFAIVLEPGAVDLALEICLIAPGSRRGRSAIVGPADWFDGERYVEA